MAMTYPMSYGGPSMTTLAAMPSYTTQSTMLPMMMPMGSRDLPPMLINNGSSAAIMPMNNMPMNSGGAMMMPMNSGGAMMPMNSGGAMMMPMNSGAMMSMGGGGAIMPLHPSSMMAPPPPPPPMGMPLGMPGGGWMISPQAGGPGGSNGPMMMTTAGSNMSNMAGGAMIGGPIGSNMGYGSPLNNMSMLGLMAGAPPSFPSLATRTSGATIDSRFDQRVKVLHVLPLRAGMRAEAERVVNESMRIWQSIIGLLYCSCSVVGDVAYLMVEWANNDCLAVGAAEWDRGYGKDLFGRLFRDCVADMTRCQTFVIGNNVNLRDGRIPGPLRTLFDHAVIVPASCGFFR